MERAKVKVGIVTIHNVSNYGAVLQAYALKETIGERFPCYIIDFDNEHVSKSLKYIRFGTTLHQFLGMGKDICRILPRSRVIPKFKRFIADKLNVVRYDKDTLKSFDTFVSGSDQIWNPACVSSPAKFVPEYFLNFASAKQKKISYASSCGAYKFNSVETEQLKSYLKDYASIAVREKPISLLLTDLLGKDVHHVLDPTLLLSKEDWLARLGNKQAISSEEYILVYVIKKTDLLKKTIKKIKNALGIKVILVEQGLYFDKVIDQHIRDAGPEDFINLFNNARFVVTDSFHGTTFSVIFNKPFYSVSPGENVNRISSLLNTLNLQSRIISEFNDLNNVELEVDFLEPKKLLKEQMEYSKSYLFNSLENNCNANDHS